MGCPRHIVTNAIVDSVIQVSKDAILFKKAFEHEVDADVDVDETDNDSITIDLSDYVSETLRPYNVLELKIDGTPWDTSEFYLESDVDDIGLYEIQGTKFFNFPDTGSIKFFPFDTTDDVTLFLNMSWLPLRTMTTVDDSIYDDHRQAVEAYSKYLLMRQPNKAWTNLRLAEFHMDIYRSEMGEGKIRQMMGKTFGSMRVKAMRFF